MTHWKKVFLACLLAFLGLAAPTPGNADDTRPPGDLLSARISIDLEDADAEDVLSMFAQILSAEPDLAPEVGGKVTLRLRNVTARTALNATCESIGCRWHIQLGNPSRLVVVADENAVAPAEVEAQELDSRLTMHVEGVPGAQLFRTSARILGAAAEVDPAVSGPVTLHAEDRPVREVFDLLCEQVSCRWELIEEPGEAPVLRVMPR